MPEKLVYIGEVLHTERIPTADRLELALVDCKDGGVWSGLVPVSQFVAGDRCTVWSA